MAGGAITSHNWKKYCQRFGGSDNVGRVALWDFSICVWWCSFKTLGLSGELCYQKHHPGFWDGTWGFSCKTGTCNGLRATWIGERHRMPAATGVCGRWAVLCHHGEVWGVQGLRRMQVGWTVGVCINDYIHGDCELDINTIFAWRF